MEKRASFQPLEKRDGRVLHELHRSSNPDLPLFSPPEEQQDNSVLSGSQGLILALLRPLDKCLFPGQPGELHGLP